MTKLEKYALWAGGAYLVYIVFFQSGPTIAPSATQLQLNNDASFARSGITIARPISITMGGVPSGTGSKGTGSAAQRFASSYSGPVHTW